MLGTGHARKPAALPSTTYLAQAQVTLRYEGIDDSAARRREAFAPLDEQRSWRGTLKES